MTKEFDLSDKIIEGANAIEYNSVIPLNDVKEFIKRLKEINFGCGCCTTGDLSIIQQIDKLAGDKLK